MLQAYLLHSQSNYYRIDQYSQTMGVAYNPLIGHNPIGQTIERSHYHLIGLLARYGLQTLLNDKLA